MSEIADIGGYSLTLYRATVRLARGVDTAYIVAHHMEDAVQQIRNQYEDLNVLYLESIERLAGAIFVSEKAQTTLRGPVD